LESIPVKYMLSPEKEVRQLLRRFGPAKSMSGKALSARRPQYFLLRRFLGDIDLAVILNTKRCPYQCRFCGLPNRASLKYIEAEDIVDQFIWICSQVRHSLSLLDRVSLSNDGSVFDQDTFPTKALDLIVQSINELPSVCRIIFETRLRFMSTTRVRELQRFAPRIQFDILTGYETLNERIRDEVLGKYESLEEFLKGLDRVAMAGCALTVYVLFKPDPHMSDKAAVREASDSILYLKEQCLLRHVPLSIRLNPMYAAKGTPWAQDASDADDFLPPRLTDVLHIARQTRLSGIPIHIGLSTEGLSNRRMTYMAREDFSRDLFATAKQFNIGEVK